MNKTCFHLLACLAITGLGATFLPAATVPKATTPPKIAKPAVPKVLGGPMPLPVDQRLERQNSSSDKLLIEVTHSAKEGAAYVAYVKIIWGDLDNVLKTISPKYYSDWDGALKLSAGTGTVNEKIRFDDGTPKKPLVAAVLPKTPAGPRTGSGRDAVVTASGLDVTWKAGVVGALDGLRIKITSPTPNLHATLTAGKFVIPITITPGTGLITPPAAPPLTAPPVPTQNGAGAINGTTTNFYLDRPRP